MTDKELLEFASKAAGYNQTKFDENGWFYVCVYEGNPLEWELWNPLTDDGERYRLAKKLNIDIDFSGCFVSYFCESTNSDRIIDWFGEGNPVDDAYAVVFAAAEIGKTLG